MTLDYKLDRSFVPVIALQIRRQIQVYVAKSAVTAKAGISQSLGYLMPITQVYIKPKGEDLDNENEKSLLVKRKRSEATSAEEELELKVRLMLNHPKYLPLQKSTPEQRGMLTNQNETSISDSTPLKFDS